MTAAVETTGLGKRYGATWALQDLTLTVPAGRVSALVGANGAGKTTLLRLLAGVARPTNGTSRVAGMAPADDPAFLHRIGYVAQDIPLYRRWTVADHLRLGAELDDGFDGVAARDRLDALAIPLDRRVGALSGGMRAQVALAVALGKHPDVLLLDEPLAALDPLARRDFLAGIVTAVADRPLTVLLSSHLLPDLERICDHLVVIDSGRLVLADDIDSVLASHRLVSAPTRDTASLERVHDVVSLERTTRQVSAVVRLRGPLLEPGWDVEDVSLQDIVLAYPGQGRAAHRPPPTPALALVEDGR
jgi:ABC-2 type transport system ATP-binding protein